MNLSTLSAIVVAGFAQIVARANDLVAFGDLPFNDHIAERKEAKEPQGYAKSLRLAVKGALVDEHRVPAGHYAVVDGETINQLGDDVDVIPLAKLNKAIDLSDSDNVVLSFDPSSDEYKQVQADLKAGGFGSKCMVGPVYLVYERSTSSFYEVFCMNASMQTEATKVLDPALPISKSLAALHDGVEPKGPDPINFGSKYLKKAKYPRYVPLWKASTAVWDNPPTQEAAIAAVTNFLKQAEVESDDHDR